MKTLVHTSIFHKGLSIFAQYFLMQSIVGLQIAKAQKSRKKKTHQCCNIVCGVLFLTEGTGQPQLSRVFQDVPKRRVLSDTASHAGLSPSHTETLARSVCVACLS